MFPGKWLLLLPALVALAASQQSCNPRTGECFAEPPPQERPHFWIGKTPMCSIQPSACALYGFEYDVSHPRGRPGDKWCRAGNKVRCVSPVAPPLAAPSPANELTFAAYNIFERDFYISHDGQRERTCRIPHWLALKHPDVDVITIQEAFMGGCIHNQKTGDLRALLTQHGFPYYTDQVENSMKPQPGGIFVASRWPILEEDSYVFKANDPSWDIFAAKGVSYAKINKTVEGESRVFHVMGTHLIAADKREDTRNKQMKEWREFVVSKNIPPEEAVVYGGDINEALYRNPHLLEQLMVDLHANMATHIYGDLNYTAESIYNDVRINANPNGNNDWIDHVAYSRDHLQPVSAVQHPVHANVPASERFPVCWCEECKNILAGYLAHDDPKCKEVVHLTHLSDHNPVIGRFVF